VFRVGSKTGETADLETNDIFWFFRPFVRLVFEKVSHNVVPDRSSTRDTRDNPRIHGRVIVIANPGSNQEGGSKTQGPVIPEIIGSAGFDRDSVIGNN